MDYEKKYKDALERAKKEAIDGFLDAVAIDTIFPELKEGAEERIRKELICFLETEIPQCNAREKYIAWLENQCESNLIEEKQGENKSAAWSNKDSLMLKCTISAIQSEADRKDGYINKDTLKDLEKWLISLKDRYAWKPSEGQMKSLKEACDEHWEPDGLDPLYTLWRQLKKLREE